jgi:hypothetical protein
VVTREEIMKFAEKTKEIRGTFSHIDIRDHTNHINQKYENVSGKLN